VAVGRTAEDEDEDEDDDEDEDEDEDEDAEDGAGAAAGTEGCGGALSIGGARTDSGGGSSDGAC
jgi:hypothetical protein